MPYRRIIKHTASGRAVEVLVWQRFVKDGGEVPSRCDWESMGEIRREKKAPARKRGKKQRGENPHFKVSDRYNKLGMEDTDIDSQRRGYKRPNMYHGKQ